MCPQSLSEIIDLQSTSETEQNHNMLTTDIHNLKLGSETVYEIHDTIKQPMREENTTNRMETLSHDYINADDLNVLSHNQTEWTIGNWSQVSV